MTDHVPFESHASACKRRMAKRKNRALPKYDFRTRNGKCSFAVWKVLHPVTEAVLGIQSIPPACGHAPCRERYNQKRKEVA